MACIPPSSAQSRIHCSRATSVESAGVGRSIVFQYAEGDSASLILDLVENLGLQDANPVSTPWVLTFINRENQVNSCPTTMSAEKP